MCCVFVFFLLLVLLLFFCSYEGGWPGSATSLFIHVQNTVTLGAGVIDVFEELEEERQEAAAKHEPEKHNHKYIHT